MSDQAARVMGSSGPYSALKARQGLDSRFAPGTTPRRLDFIQFLRPAWLAFNQARASATGLRPTLTGLYRCSIRLLIVDSLPWLGTFFNISDTHITYLK
jgi:hypothetical protein